MLDQLSPAQVTSDFSKLSLWQRFWMALALLVVVYVSLTTLQTILFPASPLTVIGTGKKSVTPEQASFIVARVNTGSSASSTINEGEAGILVLIDTTKSVVGDDAEIKKSFNQLTPVSASSFQVLNAFSVKTKNVNKVNEVVKSLYESGATQVTNISFTSVDEEKTTQEARVLAVKDAREQAKAIAKAAGKRVGKVISIADDNAGASSTVGSSNNTAGQAQNSSALGSIDITKQVSVTFEIW